MCTPVIKTSFKCRNTKKKKKKRKKRNKERERKKERNPQPSLCPTSGIKQA
jgi:hypothetical protein